MFGGVTGGCEQRIEVFMKIQKRKWRSGGEVGSGWGRSGWMYTNNKSFCEN